MYTADHFDVPAAPAASAHPRRLRARVAELTGLLTLAAFITTTSPLRRGSVMAEVFEGRALLGQEATVFPSHHGGFLGGEFGYAGRPEEFAAKLREVLDAGGHGL